MSAQQLGFDEMPRPLRMVTPAKLDSFDSCPRKFRYTYIDRPAPSRGAPWAHTGIGSAVHNALRDLWDLPLAERTGESAARLVRRYWPDSGFRDDRQRERAREIAASALATYVDDHLDPEHEPRGIERTVGAPYADLSISGRIDRVDEYEDADGRRGLVVIDYKTGRGVPNEDDVRSSMQLALYAVAVERTLRAPCDRVELHHIPTSSIASASIGGETRERQLRRAGYTADDIDTAKSRLEEGVPPDEAYPARPSTACGWCDFWAHCSEGRAVTDRRDPWFAVPGEPGREWPASTVS